MPGNGSLEERLAASDAPWNIITIAPGVHQLLENAFSALKWLGLTGEIVVITQEREEVMTIEYAYCRVQWFWLSPTIHDEVKNHIIPHQERLIPRRCVRLDSEEDIESLASVIEDSLLQPHKRFSPRTTKKGKGKEKVTGRDELGRLIETGRVFQLKVDKRDLEKTKTVVEAQWLLSRKAAFSGAADVWDQLNRQSPPTNSLRPARYQTMPRLRSPSPSSLATEDDYEDEDEVLKKGDYEGEHDDEAREGGRGVQNNGRE